MGFGAENATGQADTATPVNANAPEDNPKPKLSRRQRRQLRKEKIRAAKSKQMSALDQGLARLRNRLGFTDEQDGATAVEEPKSTRRRPQRVAAPVRVGLTEDHPRVIFYTPDVDGQADPGEVVWIWAPGNEPSDPPQERAMLVVGRSRSRDVLGLLISPNQDHAGDENWMEIGGGYWDPEGRPSWVRLDRLIEVPEVALRREGALFPRGRFERIASALRSRYGWA